MTPPVFTADLRAGPLAAAIDRAVTDLAERDAVDRLWQRDHTLWQEDPTECADRLGWLEVPGEMIGESTRIGELAADIRDDGYQHIVLCGMGGSSLFPEVLSRSRPPGTDGLELTVLDTTHPDAVRRVAERRRVEKTVFVVSSKSGSTIETASQLARFWADGPDPADFVVVSDPGSPLTALATERGFRAVFANRPDIGGRFSALSHFGLVPAGLLGLPWAEWLRDFPAVRGQLAATDHAVNPGVLLAAAMGAGARAGRDKLTVELAATEAPLAVWIEQLVAESTGKHGTGVVPVIDETRRAATAYADDRMFVVADADRARALAAAGQPVLLLAVEGGAALFPLVLCWEVATALAGSVLGLNPFDQPDVAAAKEATNRVLAGGQPPITVSELARLTALVRPGDVLAITAFVDPGDRDALRRFADARTRLGGELGVATTFGLGPRFLHSTGQLHKGGSDRIVVIQVRDDPAAELDIPDRPFGFGSLLAAQADGDLHTLAARDRRAGRVAIDDLT